jgi:hypothetical protein
MSKTVESKNMSDTSFCIWKSSMKCYIKLINNIYGRNNKLLHSKEMFDFMVSDLSWMDNNRKFKEMTKKKLTEFNEDIEISEYYKEYFRSVEETLGFVKYCGSITGKGYRCATSINGKNNNYCKMHEKVLKRKSLRISEIIGSSDVSMLIAQYV